MNAGNRAPLLALALVVLAATAPEALFAGSRPRQVEPVYQSWKPGETLKRGVELWARGSREKALEAFAEAARVLPCDPVAWHNLGVALAHFGRHEEAISAFARERLFRPNSPCATYCAGLSLEALGRLEEAETHFLLAVAAAPSEWLYWESLARVLAKLGKNEDARTALRNAARLKPAGKRHGIRGFLDLRPPKPRLKAFPPAR